MENEMGMTDYQFRVFLKMIYELIKSSRDLEDAKSKIEKLIKN